MMPLAKDVPVVPFQSMGFCGSLTHSMRYGSSASLARAMAIVGGSPPSVPGGAPSTTS